MKTDVLNKLEKDSKLKKKYLPKYFWLKNMAIYPPCIFLFFALFGLIYLLNYDMLLTYHAIPFAVLFALATIWLKTTRRYVLKKLFEKPDSYLICLAKNVKEQSGWIYVIFTTGSKRHNKYYIQNLAKELESSDILETDGDNLKESAKRKAEKLSSEFFDSSDEVYIKAFKKDDMTKSGYSYNTSEVIPVFFIENGDILLIKSKDVHFS